MAHKFPNAYVVGIDAAPVPIDKGNMPHNLRFEVDDINRGLDHFHGEEGFDLIHMRGVQSGINELDQVIIDLQHCLKPGGLLIIVNMTPELWDQDGKSVPKARLSSDDDDIRATEGGSWLARILFG
jgi:SAM-dependent methyltransferase